MSRDEDKLIRQLSLVAFLLSKPRCFSAREIHCSVEGYAEMTEETFTRRFYADREDLAALGIHIQEVSLPDSPGSPGARGFLLREEDFHLPQVEFSGPELRALSVALAALEGRFAYARPLRLALTSIFHGQRYRWHDQLDELPVVLAPDEDANRAGRQLAQLEEATTRRKTVRFLYPVGLETAAHRERTVDPYSLFFTHGHWYVVGYDHDRQAIRTFRVTRIKGLVRFATEKAHDFVVPADYDPAAYQARPPWLLGPVKGRATLRVGDDLAWLGERLAPHAELLPSDEAGCSLFTMPYADEDLLLSWVVGLGACGDLLGPPALRDRLHDRLTTLARKHAGEPQPAAVDTCSPSVSPLASPSVTTTPDFGMRPAPIPPERLARAIALVQYLLSEADPRVVPWSALLRDLGLSRQEVEADLSLVNLVNFGGGTYALYAAAEEDGVHVVPEVMAETFARPARLSPLMARALLLALDLLGEGLGVPGLESLSTVRAKVEALVGPLQAPRTVFVESSSPAECALLEHLNKAIGEHRLVELEYFVASREELTKRVVEPYLLFRNPDGWYLEAYCLTARAQRTFKLERIGSALLTNEGFTPRPEMDLTCRQTGQAYLPDRQGQWAELTFASRWLRHLQDLGFAVTQLKNGDLRARVPYTDDRWLVKFTLSYLGDAVLETPVGVRALIREAASNLAQRYAPAGRSAPPRGAA